MTAPGGANSYGDSFEINLDDATAGTISFSGDDRVSPDSAVAQRH